MSPTRLRDRASKVAPGDAAAALAIARSIDDPWFRCQALAAAAEHTADRDARHRIIGEALRVATLAREPNRIVTVSAWPLRLLYADGERGVLEREIDRLLRVIAGEPHPTRRNDALFWIWHLIKPAPAGPFLRLLKAFHAACAAGHGWRRDRNLRDMALYLRKVLPHEAAELAAMVERPRVRRQTYRLLASPDGDV